MFRKIKRTVKNAMFFTVLRNHEPDPVLFQIMVCLLEVKTKEVAALTRKAPRSHLIAAYVKSLDF